MKDDIIKRIVHSSNLFDIHFYYGPIIGHHAIHFNFHVSSLSVNSRRQAARFDQLP
jgi:hypothetical protein